MNQQHWPSNQLTSHMGQDILRCAEHGTDFSLVTLVDKAGPSPRRKGAQMLVHSNGSWVGEISGGCVEGNLAVMACECIGARAGRHIRLGEGGEFVDIQLPCGSSIDVAIDPFKAGDCTDLIEAIVSRKVYDHTGQDPDGNKWRWQLPPAPRLLIHGRDSVAIALADLAVKAEFEVVLSGGIGYNAPDGLTAEYFAGSAAEFLARHQPDPWTALVTTMHDVEADCHFLGPALQSRAFFTGVLGSKQHVEMRNEFLRRLGLSADQIARLSAPVGLDIGAATPWGIAVSILAEIIERQAS